MATQFTSVPLTLSSDMLQNSATQQQNLGTAAETNDGRKFRYVKAGASDLVVGNLLQSPAQVANHLANAVASAAAVGANQVTVTLGATAATANQYAGGLAVVSTTPGLGYSYRIKSHPAAALSASLTLTLDDPITIALTTSSKIDLVLNPYNGVLQNPTTATGTVVGVCTHIITAAQFGWIQTGGTVGILDQGGITVGKLAVASVNTAGAVQAAANASTEAQAPVGIAVTTGVDGQVNAIKLQIE